MLFLQSHLSALLVPGSCSNAHLAWSHLRRNWGVSGSLSGNPEKETHKRVPVLVPWELHPTSSKPILSLRTHLGRQELDPEACPEGRGGADPEERGRCQI